MKSKCMYVSKNTLRSTFNDFRSMIPGQEGISSGTEDGTLLIRTCGGNYIQV